MCVQIMYLLIIKKIFWDCLMNNRFYWLEFNAVAMNDTVIVSGSGRFHDFTVGLTNVLPTTTAFPEKKSRRTKLQRRVPSYQEYSDVRRNRCSSTSRGITGKTKC